MENRFPKVAGREREGAIIEAIRDGEYEISWKVITSVYGAHGGEFHIFADALRIDGVRINVSAETQQTIADMVGCSLLTPKLADLAWVQKDIGLPPYPMPISSTTEAMTRHSRKIDDALEKLQNPAGLIQTTGKHWVISEGLRKAPGRAMNYGWHFEGPSYQGIHGQEVASKIKDPAGKIIRLIQGCGTAHDMHHSDYSQTCVLVARSCIVDGQEMDLWDVLRDPELSWLASHEGPMTILRQPGVSEPEDKTIYMPKVIIKSEE